MPSNVVQFTIQGVDRFSGTMGKVSKTLGSVLKVSAAATATITGVGVAMFAMTKKFTAAEDRVAKFSKRLGIAVEELTALEFAGERSGVAISQLDMSVQRLERRSAEAAQGMGEAQGALKELGIDAKKFSQLGLEDKMGLLAKQLEGVTDAGDRTRIAFKLFDSEGVSMLQMLGDGEEAFRGLTAEARTFGAVISKQAAANAERFQDALTNMSTVTGGIFRGISDEVTPIFTNLMDRVTDFFMRNRDTIIEWSKSVIKSFWTVVAFGEKVWAGLGKTVEQFTTFEGFKTFTTNFKNAFSNIAEAGFNSFLAISKFIIKVFKVAFEGVKAIGVWAWENIKGIFSGKEGPSLAELLFQTLPEATEKAMGELKSSFTEVVETGKVTFEALGTGLSEVLNISMDGIDERVQELAGSFQTFGTVVEETVKPVIDSTKTAADEMVKTVGESMTSVLDSISEGLAGVIVEGGSMMDVLRNAAKSVLKDVLAMLIKMGIQRVATALMSKGAAAAEASTEGAKAIGLTFANTMASWAGAPWPISMAAPAMASANMATAAAGMTAGMATGAGLGAAVGAAHGGLTNVPSESTYLLQKGERVLSPNQNQDFTDFISAGGAGGGLQGATIIIHLFENATSADALLSMDPKELKEVVADKIIPALDELHNDGIRPRSSGGM